MFLKLAAKKNKTWKPTVKRHAVDYQHRILFELANNNSEKPFSEEARVVFSELLVLTAV